MKILFVITKSNWGGAQHYVHTLATHYAHAGDDVAVLAGGSGERGASAGRLAERLSEDNIRTIVLPSLMRDISFADDVESFFGILRILREERPNVLHLNSSKIGGLGSLAGRLAGVPKIIFTAHGWAHAEPRPFLERALIWLASWFTVLLSHQVIVLSAYDARRAPALLAHSRLRVIPNGVKATELLSRDEARAQLSRRIPELSAPTQWVMCIAELHHNKGIDTLIRAFPKLIERHPLVALLIIGEGEEHNALRALVQSLGLSHHVFFLGFLPEARQYLSTADIFVLPSRKEGLPYVLLEAGLAGVPVIATSVGAIPELVRDEVNGLLLRPDDPESLTAHLDRLLSDEDLRKKLSHALKEHVQRAYSLDAMFSKTRALYTNS